MKKTRKIQLVLITAALASCNRQWVPRQSLDSNPADSSLTAAPAGGVDFRGTAYNDPLYPCDCNDPYSTLWNYSFNPFATFYLGSVTPGAKPLLGKGAFGRPGRFVIRGGIGKSAFSAGS